MSAETNKEIVRKAWGAASQGLEVFLAAHAQYFSRDEVMHMPGMGPLGFAEHEQFDRMFFGGFPDARFSLDRIIAERDKVSVRFTMRMTHAGEFQGVLPTGRPVTAQGIAIYAIREGKVVEEWVHFDALGLMQQIGALPSPAA